MKKIIPHIKEFTKRADMVLFSLCLICAVFGIIIISSATASFESVRFVLVQTTALFIGIILFVIFTVIDVDIIADKWAYVLAFEVILMLLLVTPLGYADNTGNRAWLRFGIMGVQPTEVIKIGFIIVMAKQMTYLKNYKDINSVSSIASLLIHCGAILLLIMVISRDMGSALVFLFLFIVMLYAAGVKLYWFLIGAAGVAAFMPIFWTKILNQRYRDRILCPYNPNIDPQGFDIRWQANQSKLALVNGGLDGMGLFEGTQTQTARLPAKQTDFIFSVVGEELGMIACVALIALLIAIIFRCIYVGIHSGSTMGMLVCFGVAGSLIFQTFENIGMCLGIAPVIGITLPFVSYGGSSMFSMFAAVGLVSGIKYRPKPVRFRSYLD